MTETLSRPSRPSLPPRRACSSPPPTRGAVVAGVLAAAEAAALGLLVIGLPLLLVWAADPRSGAGFAEAVRTIAGIWLLASGAVLEVPDGTFGLTPLALVALPVLLLARAAARQGRSSRLTSVGRAVRLAATTGVAYAGIAVAVASLAGSATLRAGPVPVAAVATAVGFTGALVGCLRVDRLWRAAWLRLPAGARRLVRATTVTSAALAAAGALLVGTSLAVHGGSAIELARASDPGPVGGLALLLVGLSFVPNAVVWGVSWLAGPGFAVGAGTAVGPFGTELGPVPALPLLAALPASGVPGWVGALALLVPLAAGAFAGRLVQRELVEASGWRVALTAGATGPAAGAAWAVLAWLSGGPAGGGRLAQVGPSPWEVGVTVAGLVGVGAALSAALLRRLAVRRTAVAG